jgi:hypothetical protein
LCFQDQAAFFISFSASTATDQIKPKTFIPGKCNDVS